MQQLFRRAAFRRSFNVPMNEDVIRARAPSIFSEAAHQDMSGRYSYIPTYRVLEALREQGFEPYFAHQTRTRLPNGENFAKHIVRLRHASQVADSGEIAEIILLNSHDGSSSYQMLAGMYRMVCANGLMLGEKTNDVRIRHSGKVIDNVIDGAFSMLESLPDVHASRNEMRAVTLNREEQHVFADAALALRYDEGEAPITSDQLLTVKRHQDAGNDLWTVFNRTQEHLMRGGLRGRTAKGKPTTTRAVNGIDQGVKLNRALWLLADGMQKIKG
jgi:hypothetical protein